MFFCFGEMHVTRTQSFISLTSATLPTAHDSILLYQLPICLLGNIETSPFHENNVAELVSFSTRPFLLLLITSPYGETFWIYGSAILNYLQWYLYCYQQYSPYRSYRLQILTPTSILFRAGGSTPARLIRCRMRYVDRRFTFRLWSALIRAYT